MDPRVIALHDEALQLQPEGASHDVSLCPICVDWSLDESGVPACFERLDEAQRQAPFGDVEYADPGLLEDGASRYPLDTESHIRAVIELLDRDELAERYSSDELKQMRQRAQSAFGRIGAKSQEAASEQPTEEGGSTPVETITKETHEALLQKAIDDATRDAAAEAAQLREQVETLTSERDEAQTRADELAAANEDVNAKLDEAQVQIRTVTDERDQLKDDIAKRDEEAQLKELADERAEQVKNLALFPEDYVTEKAQVWAKIPTDDWAERIEEWSKAKGSTGGEPLPDDHASAMNGGGSEPPAKPKSARRAVLGLD